MCLCLFIRSDRVKYRVEYSPKFNDQPILYMSVYSMIPHKLFTKAAL